jgi:hypothetical protein
MFGNVEGTSIHHLEHLVFFEKAVCNDQAHDFAGAFIDFSDPGISVMALGRHVCHVTHSTQHLDGLEGEKEINKVPNCFMFQSK